MRFRVDKQIIKIQKGILRSRFLVDLIDKEEKKGEKIEVKLQNQFIKNNQKHAKKLFIYPFIKILYSLSIKIGYFSVYIVRILYTVFTSSANFVDKSKERSVFSLPEIKKVKSEKLKKKRSFVVKKLFKKK